MKRVFLGCLLSLMFFATSAEDFEGIKDFKFGMSRAEIREVLLQTEPPVYDKENIVKLSKKKFQKAIKNEQSYDNSKELKEMAKISNYFRLSYIKSIEGRGDKNDGNAYLYDETNLERKTFNHFFYMGETWEKVYFNFIDNKLYEINLRKYGRFNKSKLESLLESCEAFEKRYEIEPKVDFYLPDSNLSMIENLKKNAIKLSNNKAELKFEGINKKNKNTFMYSASITDRRDGSYLSFELTFHSDTPEYTDFKNQEKLEKQQAEEEKKQQDEAKKQKIYDEL